MTSRLEGTSKLEGRVALVTGASRGIGAAVAKRFAAEGAHVILAARTVGGLEEVDDAIRTHASEYGSGGQATLAPLDLREPEQIAKLGQAVADRWGRLDILVGNAAILGDLTPVAHAGPAMWERVFQVNVTANLHLIQAFDGGLRASGSGRALFVTSGITQMDAAYWSPYAASKSALEAMVRSYAAETAKTSLRVNLVDPGVVRTAMRAQAFPGENAALLSAPEAITDLFVALAGPGCSHHGQRLHA